MPSNRAKRVLSYPILIFMAFTIAAAILLSMGREAFAMSNESSCQKKQHTHSDECYEMLEECSFNEKEHTHDASCSKLKLICPLDEHIHTDECYYKEQSSLQEKADEEKGDEGTPLEEIKKEEADKGKDSSQGAVPMTELKEAEQAGQQALLDVPDFLKQGVPKDYTHVLKSELEGGGSVYLFARPDTIDENISLEAEILKPKQSLYKASVQLIKDRNIEYDNILCLNISLLDKDKNPVQPLEPVYISIDQRELLPKGIMPESIRVYHHKKVHGDEEMAFEGNGDVMLEAVLDESKGSIARQEDNNFAAVTFLTDSFSVYTITSKNWQQLNIKIQCVDESGNELISEHRPDDVVLEGGYGENDRFKIMFTPSKHASIEGYRFDNKAYFMRDGRYEERIFGLLRENGLWKYYPNENNENDSVEFSPQPQFTTDDPKDFIRLVYKKIMDVPVKYVDYEAALNFEEKELSKADAPNGKNPDSIELIGTELYVGNVDIMPKSRSYFYTGKAYAGEIKPENEAVRLIRRDGIVNAVLYGEVTIPLSKENPLKLVYRKAENVPETIKTVPTREKGLIINLFDYESGKDSAESAPVNKGRTLQFVYNRRSPFDYNKWTGRDGGIYTGLVKERLENGYPVLNVGNEESLDYLFNPKLLREELAKPNGYVRHVHTNLDHLFHLDDDGYYHYNSMTNFATIMDKNEDGGGHDDIHNDEGNFIVYSQPVLVNSPAEGENPKFLPFNKYEEANRPNKSPIINEDVKEYHFGMTMEGDFVMPPGGIIPHADGKEGDMQDMIFEFNGDDDVWVFIDDVLALDLGGIHGRYGGRINFRTGEVTTDAPTTDHGSRVQENIYGIKNIENKTPEQIDRERVNAGFGKYTKHNFKFFYLERGKGASNCEIKFNLVPVSHNLEVGKRVANAQDAASASHMWYQFEARVQHPNKDVEPLSNVPFAVIPWKEGDDPIISGKPSRVGRTDENGRFYIRSGERADFVGAVDLKKSGTDENSTKIYVSEVLKPERSRPKVYSGMASKEGSYIKLKDQQGQDRKIIPSIYDSKEYEFHVEQTLTDTKQTAAGEEIFHTAVVKSDRTNEFNWIDFENDLGDAAGLSVTKKAYHSNGTTAITDVPFEIKIELYDDLMKMYRPLEAKTPYWILKDGKKKPSDDEKPLLLDEAANGKISIKHNESIYIKLLPGTKYKVSEVLSQEDQKIFSTVYEGRIDDSEQSSSDFQITDSSVIYNEGVKPKSCHSVTITNKSMVKRPPILNITKKLSGSAPEDMLFDVKIMVKKGDSKMSVLPKGTAYTLNASDKKTIDNHEGIIRIKAGDRISLRMEEESFYRVEEVNKNTGFNVEYKLEINQQPLKKNARSPIDEIPLRENEVHDVTIINSGNAVFHPKGAFVLKKSTEGKPLLVKDSKFSFELEILGYSSEGKNEDLKLEALYYNTPQGKRQELGSVQDGYLKGSVTFIPSKISQKDLPQNEEYKAQLFLYPGESVVITGLAEGYFMSVREKLSEHDEYKVSFHERSGRITEGEFLASTEEKLSDDDTVEVICVNENIKEQTEPDIDDDDDDDDDDESSSEPPLPDNPKENEKNKDTETIPETGQLKWPIPVLSVLGAGLVFLGLYLIFKRDGER